MLHVFTPQLSPALSATTSGLAEFTEEACIPDDIIISNNNNIIIIKSGTFLVFEFLTLLP